ncbi:hypothetical protein Tco_1503008 [Tanacetum coccineum]
MQTKTELTLEQTQQGVSDEVLNIRVILKYSQWRWKSFQRQHQTSSAEPVESCEFLIEALYFSKVLGWFHVENYLNPLGVFLDSRGIDDIS